MSPYVTSGSSGWPPWLERELWLPRSQKLRRRRLEMNRKLKVRIPPIFSWEWFLNNNYRQLGVYLQYSSWCPKSGSWLPAFYFTKPCPAVLSSKDSCRSKKFLGQCLCFSRQPIFPCSWFSIYFLMYPLSLGL